MEAIDRALILGLSLLLITTVPAVSANPSQGDNCGDTLCDSSGNGRALDPGGNPAEAATPEPKYAGGFAFDGDDELRSPDSQAFRETGSMSFAVAFEVDTFQSDGHFGRTEVVGLFDDDNTIAGDRLATFQVNDNREVVYNDNGDFAVASTDTLPGTGFYTAVVERTHDPSTDTNDVEVDVYDTNGDNVVSMAHLDRAAPTTDSDRAELVVSNHDVKGEPLEGNIYEVRFWDEAIGDSTLATVADPTARGLDQYENTAEGSEEALWFLWDECNGTTCDSSGYGRALDTEGSPAFRASPVEKYDDGLDMDGTSNELRSPHASDFRETGSMSFAVAFEVDTFLSDGKFGRTEVVGLFDDDNSGGDRLGTVQVNEFGQIIYNDNGDFARASLGYLPVPGFYTLTLQRTHDPGDGTNDIEINVYDLLGTRTVHMILEDRPAPDSDTDDAEFVVSNARALGDSLDGGVYEARYWDRAVSDARLETVADLDERGSEHFETTLGGTERGLWFLGD